MADPVLVRIQTTHECLGQIAPVMANVDEAVAYVRLVLGQLLPERFLEVIKVVNPEAAEAVATMLKVCFGAGA
jgi:hypothetical protein